MDQYETWRAGRPQPRTHCVRLGPTSPSPKRAQPRNFRPISVVAKWLHGSRCHLVWKYASAQMTLCLIETQPPFQNGAEPSSQFSAHFCCGQSAGCIKMPLGMEVGLSPGDFVLDGDPAPFPKRGRAPFPVFGPFLLWPNG